MALTSLEKYEDSFKLIHNDSSWKGVECLAKASSPRDKSAVFIKNAKFLTLFLSTDATTGTLAVLDKKFFESLDENEIGGLKNHCSAIGVVANVDIAMSRISRPFFDEQVEKNNDLVDGRQLGTVEIHPASWVAQGVHLGANVRIGAGCRIHSGVVIMSDVEIGEGTELYPNVVVYSKSRIGSGCRVHSGTVIGSDGFGYNFCAGEHLKVWHLGGVVIGDNVEIGSNCSIDRGTFDDTIIGSGTKIDNLVQIAHNCNIGKGVILCGQVGVAGSATIGDFTVVGGDANIAPDIVIGQGCQIGGMAGVTGSVESGSVIAGFPARPVKEWLRTTAAMRKMALNK